MPDDAHSRPPLDHGGPRVLFLLPDEQVAAREILQPRDARSPLPDQPIHQQLLQALIAAQLIVLEDTLPRLIAPPTHLLFVPIERRDTYALELCQLEFVRLIQRLASRDAEPLSGEQLSNTTRIWIDGHPRDLKSIRDVSSRLIAATLQQLSDQNLGLVWLAFTAVGRQYFVSVEGFEAYTLTVDTARGRKVTVAPSAPVALPILEAPVEAPVTPAQRILGTNTCDWDDFIASLEAKRAQAADDIAACYKRITDLMELFYPLWDWCRVLWDLQHELTRKGESTDAIQEQLRLIEPTMRRHFTEAQDWEREAALLITIECDCAEALRLLKRNS